RDGVPVVTTCTSSCPSSSRTVYCQEPAHSGPRRTVTLVRRSTTPFLRSRAITAAPDGYPAQSTAALSANRADGLMGRLGAAGPLGGGEGEKAGRDGGEAGRIGGLGGGAAVGEQPAAATARAMPTRAATLAAAARGDMGWILLRASGSG